MQYTPEAKKQKLLSETGILFLLNPGTAEEDAIVKELIDGQPGILQFRQAASWMLRKAGCPCSLLPTGHSGLTRKPNTQKRSGQYETEDEQPHALYFVKKD